jgi:hypothetical protein
MLPNHCVAIAALLLLSGCPTTNSGPPMVDAGVAGALGTGGAGGSSAGAADETKLPPLDAGIPLKPLAEGCASGSECASDFCVDAVCCNTACDGQCFNCDETGAAGYCTAQTSGDDLNAATPCTIPRTCSPLSTTLNVGGCRMKDAQACKAAGDCASFNCVTYYVDIDRDGYGDSSTTLMLCEETGATPPGGYVATGGDCCDSDIDAHPNALGYHSAPDACGDWDYNCDGTVEGEAGPFKYPEVADPSTACGVTTKGTTLLCQ